MRLWMIAIACLGVDVAARADERPNFLIILADDVGRDAIGCYGGLSHETANVDRLAEQGMRFDHAYVMPSCHPTRTTLLSGRYPHRQGNPRWGSYPAEEEATTFASLLRNAGYATAIAGKWQLSLQSKDPQQPSRMGFDESCLFGWHEGPRYWQPMLFHNGVVRDDVQDRYGPDVYVEVLADFMRQHRDGPFLAYYSMALCHDVTDDLDEPVPYGPGKDRYESYAEMMVAMDERVGRIVGVVDELQLAEKTFILFLGDNGTPFRSLIRAEDGQYIREPVFSETTWGRVQGGKTSVSDSGARVPWIVRRPGTVPAGTTTEALVDGSDLLPTLLDLAGVELPPLPLDGQSFADTLTDPDHPGREWIYAVQRSRSMVADHRWTLTSDGKLFDRTADPLETSPITKETPESAAARSRLQSIAAGLKP